MKRQYRSRGSAILMVVGMVTIVAMLGTTLLVVAHMDARNSEALATRAGAESVAWNVVSAIRGRLAVDLVRGDDGPYGGVASPPLSAAELNRIKWLAYIDCPPVGPDGIPHPEVREYMDTWLHYDANPTSDPSGKPDPTRHFSKLFGDSADTVNTDGRSSSGPKDAYRVTTELMTESGKVFQISVKLEDLSARFCVNTAARPDGGNMPHATPTLTLNLREFLGDSDYTDLHAARCGGTAVNNMTEFDSKLARRMFQPDTATVPYRPFGCGDEPYLRWFKTGAETEVGRLYEALDALDPDKQRGFLTTVSCSRSLRRRPDATHKLRMALSNIDLDDTDDRNELYAQLVSIFQLHPELRTDQTLIKKSAAHLVANLWAYTDETPGSKAFAFAPQRPDPPGGNESFTVFGLLPQLVIAEAYAFSVPEVWSDDPLDPVKLEDAGWAYAIELFNPTDYPVDASDYWLARGSGLISALPAGQKWAFTGVPIVPPGGRVVLYTVGGDVDHDDNPATPREAASSHIDYFGFESGHPWYSVDVLDFSEEDLSGEPIPARIVRMVDGKEVPIDSVTKSDIGYTVDNKLGPDGQIAVGQRDDEFDRARALVAAMKKLALTSPKGHKLNAPNELAEDDNDIILTGKAKYGAPIYYSGVAMKDLGELTLLYMDGPEEGGQDFPHSIKTPWYVKPSRGRFDLRPPSVTAAGWGADGEYPNVPFGALPAEFFELLTTDATRQPAGRLYGRININTARKEVLKHLPWPGSISIRIRGVPNTHTLDEAEIEKAIDYILAYRDKRQTADGLHDYSTARSGITGSNVGGLRTDDGAAEPAYLANHRGFLTPAEVAIPLADYVHGLFGWTDYRTQDEPEFVRTKDYVKERDKLYRAISNLITVSSDTYAANIRIDLRRDDGRLERTWHYVAVIDRSNCTDKGDVPAILLFTEVR